MIATVLLENALRRFHLWNPETIAGCMIRLSVNSSNGHVSAVGSKNAFRKSFKDGSANESAITEEDETEVLAVTASAGSADGVVGNDSSSPDQHDTELVNSIISRSAEQSGMCNKKWKRITLNLFGYWDKVGSGQCCS